MTRHGTRFQTLACLACALLVLPAGCFKTIGAKQPVAATATSKTVARPRPTIDENGSGAVDHMIINGEVVAAEDIFGAEREDLQERLRTMPADVKKKTILYHYGDEWDDPAHGFVAKEFAGFAEPQKRYVLFE